MLSFSLFTCCSASISARVRTPENQGLIRVPAVSHYYGVSRLIPLSTHSFFFFFRCVSLELGPWVFLLQILSTANTLPLLTPPLWSSFFLLCYPNWLFNYPQVKQKQTQDWPQTDRKREKKRGMCSSGLTPWNRERTHMLLYLLLIH